MRKFILAFLLGILLGVGKAPGPVNASTVAEVALQSEVTQNEVVFNFPEISHIQAVSRPSGGYHIGGPGVWQQTANLWRSGRQGLSPVHTWQEVDAEWTWEMLQSGSLPPGAQLWWRWRITDANGDETVTDTKTATWLDDTHKWKTVKNGDFLRLHYYQGRPVFHQHALASRRGWAEIQ